jgi:hypothetical protein
MLKEEGMQIGMIRGILVNALIVGVVTKNITG